MKPRHVMRYAGVLAARYADALGLGPAEPRPAPSAGPSLNRPRHPLPALRSFLATLPTFSTAATPLAATEPGHDGTLQRCGTYRDHDTQGPRP